MSPNKDYLRGPSTKDRAKEAIFQGACIFGIGALSTLGTWLILGVVWIIMPIIAVCGVFRFLYGLIAYFTGYE
jgi:hypothetical protein